MGFRSRVTAIALAAGLMLSLGQANQVAQAAPQNSFAKANVVSAQQYKQLYADLVAGGGNVASDGSVTVTTDAGSMTVAKPSPRKVTRLGGGKDKYGYYVKFNRVDQGAIMAGGGAALAVAICAIPAVGWVACAAAAGLVAAATYYLQAYGRCPTYKQNLRIHLSKRGNGCYK